MCVKIGAQVSVKLPPILGLRVKAENFWGTKYAARGEIVETNGKYAIIKKDQDIDPNDWSFVPDYMKSLWDKDDA